MRWPWQKKREPEIGRLTRLIGELLEPQYADQWHWDGMWLSHERGDVTLSVMRYSGIELRNSGEPFTNDEQEWLRPKIEEVLAVARPRMAAIMLAKVERLVAEVRAGGLVRR
jgi:hypothetical protein